MSPLNHTPVHIYAKLVGLVLTLVGIAGLFLTTSMDDVEKLLGFDVNLFHNVVHLATGVLLLAVMKAATKTTSLVVGVFSLVYLALGIWGFSDGGSIDPFGLFGEINTADHGLHLGLGLLGLIAVFLSRDVDALEEEADGEYGDDEVAAAPEDDVMVSRTVAHVDSVTIPVDAVVVVDEPVDNMNDDEEDIEPRRVDEV